MKALIDKTEGLFGVELRNSRANRDLFMLRMLIIKQFPEMRLCDIEKEFGFKNGGARYYRECLVVYENSTRPSYVAIKAAFDANDYSIYQTFKDRLKYVERNKNRIQMQQKRIEQTRNSFQGGKPEKLSVFEVCNVLRKDSKHYLWAKSVINWNFQDWESFKKLKTA